MRVWTIHPSDYDQLRRIAQHRELHWFVRRNRRPWRDHPLDLPCLHEILVRYLNVDDTPIPDAPHPYGWLEEELIWPPKWAPLEQQVADLMDLQARWLRYIDEWPYGPRRIEVERCFGFSVYKYGHFPGGKLHGEATQTSDVGAGDVFRFALNLSIWSKPPL